MLFFQGAGRNTSQVAFMTSTVLKGVEAVITANANSEGDRDADSKQGRRALALALEDDDDVGCVDTAVSSSLAIRSCADTSSSMVAWAVYGEGRGGVTAFREAACSDNRRASLACSSRCMSMSTEVMRSLFLASRLPTAPTTDASTVLPSHSTVITAIDEDDDEEEFELALLVLMLSLPAPAAPEPFVASAAAAGDELSSFHVGEGECEGLLAEFEVLPAAIGNGVNDDGAADCCSMSV